MPSLQELLPKNGDVIAGKYLVEGTLGTGGMGAVFAVSHRVTGKRFAVKWLLPTLHSESDAVKRFIREAQVAGRVDHPNVVEVYDVGQEGDSFYMVMELLQGESLGDRVARVGRLAAAEACRIVIPVMRGLRAAHAAGIIHRDLKPDNIFLSRGAAGEETPKVLDFGISKMSALVGEVTSSITRAGMVMGTPHYMAPEQVRAQTVDARTDVYALGVILYQLLTNALPFPGDTYSDLVLRIMTETPKPLRKLAPDTPEGLARVVERAMARDPGARFSSVDELAQALQPFAEGLSFDALVGAAASGAATGPRPHTPLSTESRRIESGEYGGAPGKPAGLLIGTGIGAVVVLGLAVTAFLAHRPHEVLPLAKPTPALLAPPPPPPPLAAPAAAEKAVPTEGSAEPRIDPSTDLPVPNTVRIAPDVVSPARKWEPPAGSTEAARAVQDAGVSAPPAAAHGAQPKLSAPPPTAADARHATSGHHHASAQAGAKAGAVQPPSAANDKPATPGRTDAPRATHRTLGLALDDF